MGRRKSVGGVKPIGLRTVRVGHLVSSVAISLTLGFVAGLPPGFPAYSAGAGEDLSVFATSSPSPSRPGPSPNYTPKGMTCEELIKGLVWVFICDSLPYSPDRQSYYFNFRSPDGKISMVLTPTLTSNPDGTFTAKVSLGRNLFPPGQELIVTITGVGENGELVTKTQSAFVPTSLGMSLRAKATAVNHKAMYRTSISGKYTAMTCPGPFTFRVQMRRKVKQGKKTTSWSDLTHKYATNKKSGSTYYRTINLNMGTYRSVIYGKCGIPGIITNEVTLKR